MSTQHTATEGATVAAAARRTNAANNRFARHFPALLFSTRKFCLQRIVTRLTRFGSLRLILASFINYS